MLKYCDRQRKYVELALALAKMCSFGGKLTSSKLMVTCPVFVCAALQWMVVLYSSKGDFVCETSSIFSPFLDGCVEFRSTWGNLVLGVDEWVKREEWQHFYVVK
jgi:hypothetical protein